MASIIAVDKQKISLTDEDYTETARYLGYKKIDLPDQTVRGIIKECCEKLYELITPQAVYEKFSLKVQGDNLEFADLKLNSASLGINLKDCSAVYLMAATIGPKTDAIIRRTQTVDAVKAAVFQAAGAMFIEKAVDYVNALIKEEVQAGGGTTKPRFSPGYGDVPLSVQKDFFRLLPCTRIGLTLMDTLIMSPEKSVTAFIGQKTL